MGAVEDGEGEKLLRDKVASGVCRLCGEPGGVMGVEIAEYYCIWKGVEVVEL